MPQDKSFDLLEKQLQDLASPGIRPGLARLSKLLSLAGNPERKFPAVHVVGTNGKGSTAATLDSILRQAGYRTALYTSPHLVSFGERLLFNGCQAPLEKWRDYTLKVKQLIENCPYLLKDRPTYFELITAVALMMIADENIDLAVVEAGMGGRLDATNIIRNIILSVIVPLGMDHMEYLGDTLAKIANEKFAVMRPGVPALFAGGEEEIEQEFLSRARLLGSPVHIFRRERQLVLTEESLSGTDFSIASNSHSADYHTPLVGTFQADNAALAVMAAELLAGSCPRLTPDAIERGVAETSWPGRFETVSHKPLLLLDGGHNPHAMKRIVETIAALGLNNSLHVVLAMMKDKDVTESLLLLKQAAPLVYCTEVPELSRSMKADLLKTLAKECGLATAGQWSSPTEAITAALAGQSPTLCCGSLYLVGYVKGHLDGIQGI